MAQNAMQDDGGTDYSKLFVYAGPEQPDMSNMTVYEHMDANLQPPGYRKDRGVPMQANIIGSSHYMTTGGFPSQYREITSCKPIRMSRRGFQPVVNTYDITRGIDDVLIRHINGHRIEIEVCTVDHIERDPGEWSLSYTFEGDGPSAPTLIDFDENGWFTIHSYPEFNVDLWTQTTWFDVE